MIRDFKPSLFENTPSKNPDHTETNQPTRPSNRPAGRHTAPMQRNSTDRPPCETTLHREAPPNRL